MCATGTSITSDCLMTASECAYGSMHKWLILPAQTVP